MNERLRRLILGHPETVAGTVYGTIIVMSVIAAGAHAYEHDLWRLIVLAGGSAVVLWLAHVYSHALGESLSLGRRITVQEVASIARREFAVIAAAIIPLVAVALGATGVLAHRASVQLALWLGVAVLAAQGIRYARLERLHPAATFVTIGLNLAIGLALVALEVLIAH
jgi:membrane-associated PAP2 superfamily phosphatase